MIRARNIPHERHARSKYRSNDDKVPAEHMSLFSGNKQVPHILHALHAPPRARRPRPHIRPTYLLPTTRIPPASAGGPHPHRSAPPLTSPARHRLFEVPPTHDSAPLPSPCEQYGDEIHRPRHLGSARIGQAYIEIHHMPPMTPNAAAGPDLLTVRGWKSEQIETEPSAESASKFPFDQSFGKD